MRAVRSALPLTFFHGWAGPAARTGTLVLLWAQPLAGQTAVVSGAVTDSAGAPIEYARVRATGTDLRALTDGTGRFRIDYATADFQRTIFSPSINIELIGGPATPGASGRVARALLAARG